MNIPYNYIQTLKQLPIIGQTNVGNPNIPSGGRTLKQQLEEELGFDLGEFVPGLQEAIKLSNKLDDSFGDLALSSNSLIQQFRRQAKGVIELSKVYTIFEQRNKELNKAFGINTKSAVGLGKTYDTLAKDFGVSGQATRKYGQELNKLLPGLQKTVAGSGKLGSSLVKLQKGFQANLGLSGETANNFIRFAGGSEEALTSTLETAQALEKITGLQGLNRDLTRDLSNLAPQIQLQFSRIPGSLELAVLKARTLGVSFGEIAAIGGKLLDIESSVNDELEYQLLSGKRLVDQNGKSLTQQFRTAAIQGDANAQTDALNKILETQGDTIENNVFARQQLAKTLGIEESKLSAMVQQRRLLQKLGPEAEGILELQGEDLASAVDDFKAKNKDLAGDLDKLLEVADTRTTDERLVDVLGSLEAALSNRQLDKLLKIQVPTGAKDADGTAILKAGGLDNLSKISSVFLKSSTKVTSEVSNFVNAGQTLTQGIAKSFGRLSVAFDKLTPSLMTLNDAIPVFGDSVTKFVGSIGKLINQAETAKISAAESPLGTVPTTDSEDALIRLNDAILFNPNDKFNIVASTSPGALDQATADISGRGQSSGPSAQEIGAAVAQALQGVNLYVSPNELAAEMAFNSYNINA
jgi:plasmid maintenance system antidote protein VapI